MRTILLAVVFLFAVTSYCIADDMIIGDVNAPTSIASDILLAGNTATQETSANLSADVASGSIYTAVATGTVRKGYNWYNSKGGVNSKLLIYNSSEELIATSDVLAGSVVGKNTYTFSGANQITITLGQAYRLCYIMEASNNVLRTEAGANPYKICNTGNYATPPANFTETSSSTRELGIYVTT